MTPAGRLPTPSRSAIHVKLNTPIGLADQKAERDAQDDAVGGETVEGLAGEAHPGVREGEERDDDERDPALELVFEPFER